MGTHAAAPRDPLGELVRELRDLLAEVFGPPRGLMQVIPPDPGALTRLAESAPVPDLEAAARYMAGMVGAECPQAGAYGVQLCGPLCAGWPDPGGRSGRGDPTGDPPL